MARGRPVTDVTRTVDAIWRIESRRIVGALARMTGDLGLAEDLAQEAVADALVQWPESGVPDNPGAWLTAVAKRKAIDGWRRRERLDERYRAIAHDLEEAVDDSPELIHDDALRLIFTACHPVLGPEAQVALTLRVVGGLSTEELARLFLVPVPTMQQRIVRAKKTLTAARVPFEAPAPTQWAARLSTVLGVIYLVFSEGYSATSGDRLIRTDLAREALRLGRALAGLLPREPEVHGLVALMELQSSRFRARVADDGSAILLDDQDRSRWDAAHIRRGREALARADALGQGRASYSLQAAIAEAHAVAPSVDETDWERIVVLYEALGRLNPNPVVELNRAIAVSKAVDPEAGLQIVDTIARDDALRGSYLLPSVRGELLAQLGRIEEARSEFTTAVRLVTNEQQRAVLVAKLERLAPLS